MYLSVHSPVFRGFHLDKVEYVLVTKFHFDKVEYVLVTKVPNKSVKNGPTQIPC
jgi:hypothetical protein